jgi:hypothetical protein
MKSSSGMFVRNAPNMTTDEKKISFLNRYFIFKKVTDMSPAALKNVQVLLNVEIEETENENDPESDAVAADGTKCLPKKKIRKVKTGKILLDEDSFSPIIEDLVFDNVEIQTMYNGLKQKTKKKIAMIPLREQIVLVTNVWKTKQKRKEKLSNL